MMTAGAYDIATEHAILVEASAAGVWRALPEALLFGLLLGAVYDLFRIPAAVSAQKMENGSPDSGENTLTARLRRCRCRSVRGVTAAEGEQTRPPARRRLSAQVSQFMLDMLFFLVCGVSGAVFLYWRNSGILRWYLVISGVIGFFAYRQTVGVLVTRMMRFAAAALHAVLCTAFNLTLYYPLRLGYRVLSVIGDRMRQMRIRWHSQRKHRTKTRTKQQKRIGITWQRNKNSQRKKQVFSRRLHFSSSSASVPSPSFSSTGRSRTTKKKLP